MRWIFQRRFSQYRVFPRRILQRRVIQYWIFQHRLFRCWLIRYRLFRLVNLGCLRLLVDDVLRAGELPLSVAHPCADDVSRLLQLPHRFTNGVHALAIDDGQPLEGVVPCFGQGEHDRQQSFGFQRQVLVFQMMIRHNGVIPCFLNAKDSHYSSPPNSKSSLANRLSN